MPPASCRATQPKPGLVGRWLQITRAPFLSATVLPLFVGAAAAVSLVGTSLSWGLFVLAALGAIFLHIAANLWNDHFDWLSGTDQANSSYISPFTGGSRSIARGWVTLPAVRRAAMLFLSLGIVLAVLLAGLGRGQVLWLAVVAVFSVYFYTAPPLRLCARRGLGELIVGLNFGLVAVGAHYVLVGSFDARVGMLALPLGLLTAAILWVNEIPDLTSDAVTGKNHLVVVVGARRAWIGYVALVSAAYAAVLLGAWALRFTPWILLVLLTLPLAVVNTIGIFRHHGDPRLRAACAGTIALHAAFGLLLGVGLMLSS